MKEEIIDVVASHPEAFEYINELLEKSKIMFEKTNKHKNVTFEINGVKVPIRVDDVQLFYIGCLLLPNIINYLVNILPQFIYPYIVGYLQNLSEMVGEDAITVSELYNFLIDNNYGNLFECSKAENQAE